MYTFMYNLILSCIEIINYQIIRNVIIHCNYAIKFSVFEVMYFSVIHLFCQSIKDKRHMRDTPSLKIVVSAINLKAYQIALIDTISGVLRTQSSFCYEVISRK